MGVATPAVVNTKAEESEYEKSAGKVGTSQRRFGVGVPRNKVRSRICGGKIIFCLKLLESKMTINFFFTNKTISFSLR